MKFVCMISNSLIMILNKMIVFYIKKWQAYYKIIYKIIKNIYKTYDLKKN